MFSTRTWCSVLDDQMVVLRVFRLQMLVWMDVAVAQLVRRQAEAAEAQGWPSIRQLWMDAPAGWSVYGFLWLFGEFLSTIFKSGFDSLFGGF